VVGHQVNYFPAGVLQLPGAGSIPSIEGIELGGIWPQSNLQPHLALDTVETLKRKLPSLFFTLLLSAPLAIQAQPTTNAFVHPGLLQTRQDLEFMKEKVLAGQEPWHSAWAHLLSQRYSSLQFEPHAIAHVVRGSYGKPSVGDRDLINSAKGAYSQALQWVVTGDRGHAQKAIALLQAWSSVLVEFHNNDAKLLAGWTGHDFCNAAEILRHTDAGWKAADFEQFKRMLLTVYYPLIKDFRPDANGNWDAAMMDTMLCMGAFLDDRPMFDRALDHFLRGPGNGGLTKYIYPSGQCQENTRDQGHTQLGLGELALFCQVAWNQGVDLYGAADSRMALGFEYTAQYVQGGKMPAFGLLSPRGRGHLSDIYEGVYQHFHYVKGLEMPWSARALARTRAHDAWSALIFCQGPLAGLPSTPAGLPSPSQTAVQAGALAAATAQPADRAVVVHAGQSIQAALAACANAGGGWVVLAKGVHVLPAPLKLVSGVTLAGQGQDTILLLDPRADNNGGGVALANSEADLHDVTIRDLVIEGATASSTSSDPNADRYRRSRPDAPRRGGIALQGSGRLCRLRLEHVTVRNCTQDGVAVSGAAQITITACDFSDNGSCAVAGSGARHNLLLEHVDGCRISDSRLDNSPGGSGLELSQSRKVTLTNSEAARNARCGFHVTESQNVQVLGNLVEGNDGSGILLGGSDSGCQDFEVRANLCRNNGGYGVETSRALRGVVQDNRALDNAWPDPAPATPSKQQ
jgi:hypothetical protein